MPGFLDLHKMSHDLAARNAPSDAKILIHGAGGGLELETFAKHNPGWSFVGVDPAQAMLDVAAKRMSKYKNDCNLHCGFIESAPEGRYDGATSLLTLHCYTRGSASSDVARYR